MATFSAFAADNPGMDPVLSVWLVYILWFLLVVYLTVTAFHVRRDTQPHLGQSFTLLFALVAAFVLPLLPIFSFTNWAPVGPLLTAVGLLEPWPVWRYSSPGVRRSARTGVRRSRPKKTTSSSRQVRITTSATRCTRADCWRPSAR